MSNNKATQGWSFTAVLFLVFLILKLTHNIDWSWWWVFSPIWGPIAIVLILLLIGVITHVYGKK